MNRQPENYFAPSNGGLHHAAETKLRGLPICRQAADAPFQAAYYTQIGSLKTILPPQNLYNRVFCLHDCTL